jgi:FkbM family methyltransferase
MKKLIRGMAHMVGLEVHRYRPGPGPIELPSIDVLDLVIEQELAKKSDWTFIQIGAHDGKSFDPIHKYITRHHWHGVLVEPQPKLFERLKATYAAERQLRFENVAIARTDGVMDLYCLKDDGRMPYHATMLASFNRGAVANNMHGYRGEVIAVPVPAMCVATLLAKHGIKELDLLQIDTEGFDWDVLQMFAEANCWPTIVHFENWRAIDAGLEPFVRPWIDRGYAFVAKRRAVAT